MRNALAAIALIATFTAAPVAAEPDAKTAHILKSAIVGQEGARLCKSRDNIADYVANRIADPGKASASVGHCTSLAPGVKVSVILIYKDDSYGSHILLAKTDGESPVTAGYAVASAFSIVQEAQQTTR